MKIAGSSEVNRQAMAIAAAAVPFGIAFGVLARQADLAAAEAVGFSVLVFAGSAQFAAVGILADGGAVATAIVAGTLLNLRSLAFGLVMTPALHGPRWWRALASQLMIDEATAVGSAQASLPDQRAGYLATGLSQFVLWNLATALGYFVLGGSGDLIEAAGIDGTIPAAFLALLWPRLTDPRLRLLAIAGAVIGFVTTPLLPSGLPILAAGFAVMLVRPWRAPAAKP